LCVRRGGHCSNEGRGRNSQDDRSHAEKRSDSHFTPQNVPAATFNAGVAGTSDVVLPLRLRAAGMRGSGARTKSRSADKAARKGLSDRYPRKNQTFRQN
jgi:hypothetical protein